MKNINLIPAAVLSAACITAFSAAAQAQALRHSAKAIQKIEKGIVRSSQIKMPVSYRVLKMPRTAYIPVLHPDGHISGVGNMPAFRVPQEEMEKLVQRRQKQQEIWQKKQKQLRLITNTLRYRSEILKGYYLPPEYLEGFFFRRVFPYQQHPTYTPDNEEGVLFRGMLLTPEELVKILQTGFSPAHSKWNVGAKAEAVSLSSSSVEASHYIFQAGHKKDGIGVVFKIKQGPKMELGESQKFNSTQTIYYSYEDIPADDIVDVLIRGEYGLERLEDILKSAQEGTIKDNAGWVSQFNGVLR